MANTSPGGADRFEYLILSTGWAQDVFAVGQEALADQGNVTLVAVEAIAVPVALFKRDELRAANTSDWFRAATALLGEEIPVALGAIRMLFFGGKLKTCQFLLAVHADEALTMVGTVLVCYTTLVDDPIAGKAALGKLILIAGDADDIIILGDEAFAPDWLLAYQAAEAVLMPLLVLVLKLLHTGSEDLATTIASWSKVVVMAIRAVQLLVFGSEVLVNERALTIGTLEAAFMPMFLFVR